MKFPDLHIIIVAGGTGSRMNSSMPKQFIKIHNREILEWTITALAAAAPEAHYVVVMHPDFIYREPDYKSLFPQLNMEWVAGAETRFGSSQKGLSLCPDTGIVMIHDAARPMISTDLIYRLYEATIALGNAIPAVDVRQSVRQLDENGNRTIDRSSLRLIQTPQSFLLTAAQKAFEVADDPVFTDDASVLEHAGHSINLIQGEDTNIKITTNSDLLWAESLLSVKGNTHP